MHTKTILINFDGTILRGPITKNVLDLFLEGDLSWPEVAGMHVPRGERLVSQAMIVHSPDELRQLTDEVDFEGPETKIVFIGTLPINRRPVTSIFVLSLDEQTFSDIRVGTNLELLVEAGRIPVTDIADSGRLQMFDRDTPSDSIRAQFRSGKMVTPAETGCAH